MIRNQTRRIRRTIVNGVSVIMRLARTEPIPPLPKCITAHAIGVEIPGSFLPWLFFGAVV